MPVFGFRDDSDDDYSRRRRFMSPPTSSGSSTSSDQQQHQQSISISNNTPSPYTSSNRTSTFNNRSTDRMNRRSSPAVSSSSGGIVPFTSPSCGLTTMASPTRTTPILRGGPRSTPSSSSSSVRLSCLSGDGRIVHSLNLRDNTIESHTLPLNTPPTTAAASGTATNSIGDSTATNDYANDPAVANASIVLVQTPLPNVIRMALEVDPPLELLCVEGDPSAKHPTSRLITVRRLITQSSSPDNNNNNKDIRQLCLYTSKSVFLLELSVDKENVVQGVAAGRVISVSEPLERMLLGSWGTQILRVRSAPQQQSQPNSYHATLCPPQSLAVLTHNSDCREYNLHLWHASSQQVTTPLLFGVEELDEEQIVDFCFAQSKGLSLLSTLTVLLLKASSDIVAASPICFDGAIVSRSLLHEATDYFQDQLSALPKASAQWRQCRIAQQYLLDVFGRGSSSNGGVGGMGLFATAKLLPYTNCPPSTSWQVQIQGTVLFASSTNDVVDVPSTAMALECFGKSDCISFAVGKNTGVDIAVMSPTAVLPRFTLESMSDTDELDDGLFRTSSWVERVVFKKSNDATTGVIGLSISSPTSLSLVVDNTESLLHYITRKTIATISTNAVQVTDRRLHGLRADAVRTTAWSSLTVTGASSQLQGAVIDSSSNTETELVARLSDGSMIHVNVTETQIRHQIQDALLSNQSQPLLLSSGPNNVVSNEIMGSLDSTQPLYAVMEPLVKQIASGLAGLTKVVGSSTSYQDITPDQLAVALQLCERCDDEGVVPLVELKRIVKKRRERLKDVLQQQLDQVKVLQSTIATLTNGVSDLSETLERIESNGATLSQRGAAVLAASQTLVPSVSLAEEDYFSDIKRLANKTTKLEEQTERATESMRKALAERGGRPLELSLTDEDEKSAKAMLDDQAVTIQETQRLMSKSELLLMDLTESMNLNFR